MEPDNLSSLNQISDLSISCIKVIKDTMNDPFLFQRNNAAELFIVRHADAIPGEDEIIPSGIYDDLPLSRTGRKQAQALAETT